MTQLTDLSKERTNQKSIKKKEKKTKTNKLILCSTKL